MLLRSALGMAIVMMLMGMAQNIWQFLLLRALLGLPYDFIAENLLRSARKFSGRQLEEAVRLCAQTDFAMKNTGADDAELLKELLLRIAVGGAA